MLIFHHLSRNLGIVNHWLKKTKTFPMLTREIFPRRTPPKIPPFPRKMGTHMRAPYAFEWGGGGSRYVLRHRYNLDLWRQLNEYGKQRTRIIMINVVGEVSHLVLGDFIIMLVWKWNQFISKLYD